QRQRTHRTWEVSYGRTTLVVEEKQHWRPRVRPLDRCHSGEWSGLGPLGHAHDVGQLGDWYDAHDVSVVGRASRGSGLLHALVRDWRSSGASGDWQAWHGKRSRHSGKAIRAWRDERRRVSGYAPGAPGVGLTRAVERPRLSLSCVRGSSPLCQQGKEG